MGAADFLTSLRRAAVTVAAVALTAAVAWLVDPEPGLLVFAVLLTISLSGSQLERDLRGRLEAGAALPVIAVLGAAVGALLAAAPWVGAAVFTLALTASVALRLFGPLGRRLGALVALPFTVLLVAPVHSTRLSPVLALLATIAVGLVAWASVTVLQLAGRRIRLLAPGSVPQASTRAPSARSRRITASLAAQMLVAVGGAFAVGYLLFGDRWSWIVVSALVVSLGNAGRADVTYKGVHRVVGAGVGSAVAVLLLALHISGLGLAAAVLGSLMVGIVLRPLGYGWWAASITIALALTQSVTAGDFSLLQRGEEILLGAGLAVLVAWIVLPVRSSDVVRARIAEVLARLSDRLAAAPALETDAGAAGAADRPAADATTVLAPLARVAAPFDALRLAPAAWRPPAYGWIAATRTAASLVLTAPRPGLRRPVANARRAVREPAELQAALDDLVAAARG